jgi:hypothetical protein
MPSQCLICLFVLVCPAGYNDCRQGVQDVDQIVLRAPHPGSIPWVAYK